MDNQPVKKRLWCWSARFLNNICPEKTYSSHPHGTKPMCSRSDYLRFRQQHLRSCGQGYARQWAGGISHPQVTAGTLGITVSDRRTVPHRFFVLSNNYVLNATASIGDRFFSQEHCMDSPSTDVLGHPNRFVPIQLEPPVDRDNHHTMLMRAGRSPSY